MFPQATLGVNPEPLPQVPKGGFPLLIFLAFAQLIGGILHAVVGQIADVQQAVQAGEDGHEGAELAWRMGRIVRWGTWQWPNWRTAKDHCMAR